MTYRDALSVLGLSLLLCPSALLFCMAHAESGSFVPRRLDPVSSPEPREFYESQAASVGNPKPFEQIVKDCTLVAAARAGDLAAVQAVLDGGAGVNGRSVSRC